MTCECVRVCVCMCCACGRIPSIASLLCASVCECACVCGAGMQNELQTTSISRSSKLSPRNMELVKVPPSYKIKLYARCFCHILKKTGQTLATEIVVQAGIRQMCFFPQKKRTIG